MPHRRCAPSWVTPMLGGARPRPRPRASSARLHRRERRDLRLDAASARSHSASGCHLRTVDTPCVKIGPRMLERAGHGADAGDARSPGRYCAAVAVGARHRPMGHILASTTPDELFRRWYDGDRGLRNRARPTATTRTSLPKINLPLASSLREFHRRSVTSNSGRSMSGDGACDSSGCASPRLGEDSGIRPAWRLAVKLLHLRRSVPMQAPRRERHQPIFDGVITVAFAHRVGLPSTARQRTFLS